MLSLEFRISVIVICLIFVICYLEFLTTHYVKIAELFDRSVLFEKHKFDPLHSYFQECQIIFKGLIDL